MKRQSILIELGLPYFSHARELISGILDYSHRNFPEWRFLTEPLDFFQAFQPGFMRPELVQGAFVIAYDRRPSLAALLDRGVPVINLTLPEVDLGIPSVTIDDRAVGRLAAEHLDRPAISETLYVGIDLKRSRLRYEAFSEALCARGKPKPHHFAEDKTGLTDPPARRMKRLAATIKKLRQAPPGRLGIFAFSDSFAHAVAEVCVEMGLSLPRDVVLVSCDNDEQICNLSHVPLSSIPSNGRKIGFLAAEALHSLMDGESISPLTLVEPLHVVERLSSSRVAVDDQVVAKALGIINEQAHTGLRVYEILEFLPVSRRNLEARFRKTLGCSPHEQIERVRVELAFAKLREDRETNSKIAIACGFGSSNHFERAFRKITGHPPSFFRGGHQPSKMASKAS